MVNARSFLFSFKCTNTLAYVVEFSHLKIRVYEQNKTINNEDYYVTEDQDGEVGTSSSDDDITVDVIGTSSVDIGTIPVNDNGLIYDGDNLVDIDTPYTYDDLWDADELVCKIQVMQNADFLYIFNENYPIYVLKRYSNTSWTLTKLSLYNGPFGAMNTDDITITASNETGSIDLIADAAVFSSTDVGRYIRLWANEETFTSWVSGEDYDIGDIVMSDNKYYYAGSQATAGTIQPTHSSGAKTDGGVLWNYLHDGYGIALITAYHSNIYVEATVYSRLPTSVEDGTIYWELGLLNSASKYPIAGAFFRDRFAFLLNTDTGPLVCMSCVGDYTNFADLDAQETTSETAITISVLNTEYNEGKWLYAKDVLFVGTGSSEFYIDANSSSSAFAVDNYKILEISNIGSKAISPIAIGAHVIFVDKYGLTLRDLIYNYYTDGYDQIDLSLYGKHLFTSKIINIVYQETPNKILWCLVGDGSICALTFSAEQEVAALSRHEVSGEVESIAVVPNIYSSYDELWLEVKRTVNGVNVRTVEWMDAGMPQSLPSYINLNLSSDERNKLESDYIKNNAYYLDAMVVYLREIEDDSTQISGLDHLESQEVQIIADGVIQPSQYVIDGKIDIKSSHSKVVVGLKVMSQFVPQNIFMQQDSSLGMAQRQRINHILLLLYMSGGGQVGPDEDNLSNILYRSTNAKMNSSQDLFSGRKEILFNGSTSYKENSAQIFIQNTSPLPMNILAINPYLDVSDD